VHKPMGYVLLRLIFLIGIHLRRMAAIRVQVKYRKHQLVYLCLYHCPIIFGLVVLSACETVIEVDPPDYDSELNIISRFSPDSTWAARVMRTIPIGEDPDTSGIFLADATVMIYQEDTFIDQLIYDGERDGWYVSSLGLMPKLTTPYRLVVDAPGFTSVSAESMVPPIPNIKDVSIEEITDADFSLSEHQYRISFGIANPSGLNYFNFSLYGGMREDQLVGFASYSLNSLFMRYNTRRWYCNYSDVLNPIDADIDIGSDRYCQIAVFSDRPFASQTTVKFEIDVLLDLFHFDPEDIPTDDWTHIFLVVQSLSPEYVEYNSSLENQDDFEGFEEPINLYSNVDGGHGIFAGYSVNYWVFDLDQLNEQ